LDALNPHCVDGTIASTADEGVSVFDKTKCGYLGFVGMPVGLSRTMCDVALKSSSIPHLHATIITSSQEKEMIRGHCNMMDRADMFCKSSNENALRFPRPVDRLIGTLVDSLSAT
jgi:hypothetical protein